MSKFILELTAEEIQVVGTALLEQPAKISLAVINNINGQIQEQMQGEGSTPHE